MRTMETERTEQRDVHQSNTFYNGVRALLSIGLYTAIGVFLGHYIGRWGEEVDRAGRGMSTLLGRWMGGVGLGGLAAYTSLRGAAEEEHGRENLIRQNAHLEERIKQLEERNAPKEKVHSQESEHDGKVVKAELDKAV